MEKRVVVILLFLFGSLSLSAQSVFTLSGELRPRTEYNHGTKSLIQDQQKAGIFTSQRTRLNMDFENAQLKARLVFQDVRTWGSQPQLVVSDGLTSVHEAWAEVRLLDGLSFKAGRQEISYDDHRIFGNVGWAQQARSHDAAVFKYAHRKGFKVHAGLAYNQETPVLVAQPYTVEGSYKAFQYLWLNHQIDKLQLSVLLLNNGKEVEEKILYSQTIGSRLGYKYSKLGVNFSYYHQLGNDGVGRKLDAYLLKTELAYQVVSPLKTIAGFEMQSGQSQTNLTEGYQAVNHSFTPFYGTNHKFNGFMDYFYVGNHVGSVGLNDLFFKLKYNKSNLILGVDFHYFSTAADLSDPEGMNERMKCNLGTELDLSATYMLGETVTFTAGYSQMFATESMEVLKGGRADLTNNFGYIMLTITPDFLVVKKE